MTHARIVALAFALTALAGCSAFQDKPDSVARELSTAAVPSGRVPPPSTTPEDKPISVKQNDNTKRNDAKFDPGTGRLINIEAASAPAPGSAVRAAEGEITFNFENQPIQAVVQSILGALLNENYSVSPNVSGNVTFSTSKPITSEQALSVLEMLLSWTNNALIRKQGRYEVVPIKEAVAGNMSVSGGTHLLPGYQVRVFPLKYISATEMQKLLKPYAKTDSIMTADNARSMIIVAGTAFELQNYERTISVFDVDWLKGMSVGVFGLRNVDVTKIMPELEKIFGEKAETPVGGMFRLVPMETTNSLVVITPQPEYLKRVQEWLYRLDTGVGENGTQLYVYDVKNVKAVDLSDHLNAIFTGRSSGTTQRTGGTAPGLRSTSIGGSGMGGGGIGGSIGGINSGTYSTGLSTARQNTPTGGSNLTTTGTGTPTGAAGQKESDIRITAIEENNQMLIMATPGEYDSILAAIHRLDVPPLQVQIEAKVLEVTLSGDLQFGVEWWLAGLINANNSGTGYQYGPGFQGNLADRHRAGLSGATGVNPQSPGNGLFWSYLNKNFQVALNTLQTNSLSKILSAPSMVVLNNQEATITVGTQIPITQTSIVGYPTTVGTSTSGSYTNTGIGQVSYVSTGVTLDVKPRVNPGGLVYMDVSQEVSAPTGTTSDGSNPPISQRSLQTQIAVQSGQTVLLGGLISENNNSGDSGVPLLSSIPVVGKLFGDTSRSRQRTEIIVLITPQVITNADDARQMTEEYKSRLESLVPLRTGDKSPAQPGYHAPDASATPPAAAPPPATTYPTHQ